MRKPKIFPEWLKTNPDIRNLKLAINVDKSRRLLPVPQAISLLESENFAKSNPIGVSLALFKPNSETGRKNDILAFWACKLDLDVENLRKGKGEKVRIISKKELTKALKEHASLKLEKIEEAFKELGFNGFLLWTGGGFAILAYFRKPLPRGKWHILQTELESRFAKLLDEKGLSLGFDIVKETDFIRVPESPRKKYKSERKVVLLSSLEDGKYVDELLEELGMKRAVVKAKEEPKTIKTEPRLENIPEVAKILSPFFKKGCRDYFTLFWASFLRSRGIKKEEAEELTKKLVRELKGIKPDGFDREFEWKTGWNKWREKISRLWEKDLSEEISWKKWLMLCYFIIQHNLSPREVEMKIESEYKEENQYFLPEELERLMKNVSERLFLLKKETREPILLTVPIYKVDIKELYETLKFDNESLEKELEKYVDYLVVCEIHSIAQIRKEIQADLRIRDVNLLSLEIRPYEGSFEIVGQVIINPEDPGSYWSLIQHSRQEIRSRIFSHYLKDPYLKRRLEKRLGNFFETITSGSWEKSLFSVPCFGFIPLENENGKWKLKLFTRKNAILGYFDFRNVRREDIIVFQPLLGAFEKITNKTPNPLLFQDFLREYDKLDDPLWAIILPWFVSSLASLGLWKAGLRVIPPLFLLGTKDTGKSRSIELVKSFLFFPEQITTSEDSLKQQRELLSGVLAPIPFDDIKPLENKNTRDIIFKQRPTVPLLIQTPGKGSSYWSYLFPICGIPLITANEDKLAQIEGFNDILAFSSRFIILRRTESDRRYEFKPIIERVISLAPNLTPYLFKYLDNLEGERLIEIVKRGREEIGKVCKNLRIKGRDVEKFVFLYCGALLLEDFLIATFPELKLPKPIEGFVKNPELIIKKLVESQLELEGRSLFGSDPITVIEYEFNSLLSRVIYPLAHQYAGKEGTFAITPQAWWSGVFRSTPRQPAQKTATEILTALKSYGIVGYQNGEQKIFVFNSRFLHYLRKERKYRGIPSRIDEMYNFLKKFEHDGVEIHGLNSKAAIQYSYKDIDANQEGQIQDMLYGNKKRKPCLIKIIISSSSLEEEEKEEIRDEKEIQTERIKQYGEEELKTIAYGLKITYGERFGLDYLKKFLSDSQIEESVIELLERANLIQIDNENKEVEVLV